MKAIFAILNPSNERLKFETRSLTLFTKTPKKKKYFVTDSTKYVQDLCVENYKTLMKDVEDVNTWRDRRVFIVGISILLRCQFFPTSPINSM